MKAAQIQVLLPKFWLKNGKEVSTTAEFDAITGMYCGQKFSLSFGEPTKHDFEKGLIPIEYAYDLLQKSLLENQIKLWIIIDRLDVAFLESEELLKLHTKSKCRLTITYMNPFYNMHGPIGRSFNKMLSDLSILIAKLNLSLMNRYLFSWYILLNELTILKLQHVLELHLNSRYFLLNYTSTIILIHLQKTKKNCNHLISLYGKPEKRQMNHHGTRPGALEDLVGISNVQHWLV